MTPSDELAPLLGVAVATLDVTGLLHSANAGFLRLLEPGGEPRVGTNVRRFFVQPTFATIVSTVPNEHGEIYQGLSTIGDPSGRLRTLMARIWATETGVRVVAEHNVEELERIADAMESLHRESLQSRRTLGVENLGLRQREAQMVEVSLTDALTKVGNRRKLDQSLLAEMSRVEREGTPLSVIMADIDHFKHVNDRYGHAGGDRVLARFGELLLFATRPTDIVARYGGEEFVVLMPRTPMTEATDVADRLRRLLATERIDSIAEPVTSSFGVAQCLPGEAADALIQRVDAALYQAKEAGRNRVVACT